MLLIIQGPPASGKTTIAKRIAHSTGCRHYDEMPAQRPADFPAEGLVIITTNARTYPDWLNDTAYSELFTGNAVAAPATKRRIKKFLDEVALAKALGDYIQSGIDFWAFQSSARGADNTRAQIFQYKGAVPVGEYFLCDCIGNTVDLCIATHREYRNAAGRLVPCKVVATVIPDARKTLGSPVNGEWMIPWNHISI